MSDKLTQERLHEVLHYNPETGIFTWAKKYCDKVVVGAEAGSDDPRGYRIIYIDGRNYRAHHLAFLYMRGFFPEEVDHENLRPSNNQWLNLREAEHFQNCQNVVKRQNNKSGRKGVHWRKDTQKYQVQIRCQKKVYSLGCYTDLDVAAAVYDQAALKYHGEFANLNGASK